MLELPWATAEAIGSLTITQLFCLSNTEPPGQERARSAEEYEAALQRRRSELRQWDQ